MADSELIQCVRIYLNEDDLWRGQALYLAVLERLQREGATGATVLKGQAGFGPGHRPRAASFVGLSSHVPLVIEWLDRPERIKSLLPLLDEMLGQALIVIEEVRAYRANLRSQGPLTGVSSVGDIMQTKPQTTLPTASLGSAMALMLKHRQTTLPVVDAQHRLLGVLTEQDIARRTGMLLPLQLIRLLTNEEGNLLLSALTSLPVTEVMNPEPRTVFAGASIPRALTLLVEWNHKQIPVLDRERVLVGLLGREDILRSAVEQLTGAEDEADQPVAKLGTVGMIMQTVVPRIESTYSLAAALQEVLASPHHYLVVVDAEGQFQGEITAPEVLKHLQGEERASFLAALQRPTSVEAPELPGNNRKLEEVLKRDIVKLGPTDNLLKATSLMLKNRLEQVPIVDAKGTLLGLLTRGALLRALVQEV